MHQDGLTDTAQVVTEPSPEGDPGDHRAPDDFTEEPRFRALLLRVRCASSILLPLALIAFPSFGPNRFLLAALAAAGGTAANLALIRRSRRGRPIRGLIAGSDIVSILVVMAWLPAVYAPGAMLLVSVTSLYVFWFGGRQVARLLVPTSIVLLGIGLLRQPDGWVTVWLAWAATSGIGSIPLSRMASVSIAVRNRYDDMVNGIDATVWEASGPTSDADYMSDRVTDLLGFEPDELCSFRRLVQQVVPEDRRAVIASRHRAAAGTDVEVHYGLIDAHGRRRHLHERIRVSGEGDGPYRRRGILVDETARWEAESSERSYADFVEGMPIALAILRLDEVSDPRSLRVVVGNPAASALVGLQPAEVVGRRLGDLLPLSDHFAESLADVALHQQTLERPSIRIEHLGAVFALRAVPLQDSCLGLMLEDVTVSAIRSESLQHQATHDHLTGLPNRARFNDRLNRALGRAAADGRRAAVLMIDLNQFKDVNDSLGHEVGDLLLIELARRLSTELRYCDTIARLGGDEFAILLDDSADHAASAAAAARVLELCEVPFEIDGFRLQVGASIGIARAPEHAHEARALVRHADRAMYKAKAQGGGVVEYSPLQDTEGITRISLLEDLRSAVSSEEVVVHYQPRIDLRTGRTLGIEALVRWSHPRRGLLSPGEFLELAEVSGEIEALTRAVMEQAAGDLARIDPDSALTLNINLSARNLRDPSLPPWIKSILARYAMDPSRLCFEVSEAHLVDDPERTAEGLRRLRRLGVGLSVDDFGVGGSSVAHLRELPIDEVKIDPRFIADLNGDTTVVRSVIELCHNLGLHVVAEGVESLDAVETLRALGCDSAQGFHLATPMPIDDLSGFLDHHPGSSTLHETTPRLQTR